MPQEEDREEINLWDCTLTGTVIVDPASRRIIDANRTAVEMIGADKDEIINRESTEYFRPPDEGSCPKINLNDSGAFSEGLLLRANGGTVPVLKKAYPVTLGNYRVMVESFFDITPRKKAELSLQESESRYRKLVESVTDYIYSVKVEDGHPVATIHGPNCTAVTGYAAEEYEANPYLWHQMVHDEDRDAVIEQAAKVISREDVPPLEHRIYHKDGYIRWVKNAVVPRYNEEGHLVGYDGLVSDITERKEAQEHVEETYMELEDTYAELQETHAELELAYSELATMDELKDNIIMNVSHELRTPLTIAFGSLDLLKSEEDQQNRNQLLDATIKVLDRQNKTIGDLIKVAHFHKNVLNLNKEDICIGDIILLTSNQVRSLAKEKGIAMDVETPEIQVNADFNLIKQALLNVIDNAVKFTENGGRIRVGAEKNNRAVTVRVEDTGVGISVDIREKIFDKFFQGDSSVTRRYGGIGMGLTVTKKILEAHGGNIWIKSEVGEGSKFTFSLPVAKEG